MGQPAPRLAGATADRRQLDLASFHGRWVLLNFFATWCSACCAELPQLVALATEHTRKDLAIISVVLEEPVDASRYVTDHHGTWPVIDDPHQTIAKNYLVEGLPESFLMSPNGRIVAALVGGVHRREIDADIKPASPPPV
jgi:peroxiredoxin